VRLHAFPEFQQDQRLFDHVEGSLHVEYSGSQNRRLVEITKFRNGI
jgi:hypothetical protein